MNNRNLTLRLIAMNFLEFAVWGAYLTSLGRYLGNIGLGAQIKWFFAMQGIVSIFMPTLMGILADRKIEAQKVLSLCHGLAGVFMAGAGFYCMSAGSLVQFAPLFILYSISVLHAHHRPCQLRGLQCPGQGRDGPGEGFPAHQGLRNDRFHMQYAPDELPQD